MDEIRHRRARGGRRRRRARAPRRGPRQVPRRRGRCGSCRATRGEIGTARVEAARDAYAKGCRRCPTAAPLWIAAAKLETGLGNAARARAILRTGAASKPDGRVAVAGVDARGARRGTRTDQSRRRAHGQGAAGCSGGWRTVGGGGAHRAEAQRKSKSVDALRRCEKDPRVIAAVASLFRLDRKTDKARSWFNRAVTLDPDIGDHWAMYYDFERQHGGEEAAEEIAKRCAEANPTHGETWCAVRKRQHWHDDRPEDLTDGGQGGGLRGGGVAGGQPERGGRLERGWGLLRSSANASLWKNTHLCISYTPAYAGPDPDSTTTHLSVERKLTSAWAPRGC